MKRKRLTIIFLFIATLSRGQQSDFALGNIKFEGLDFSTTKEAIIKSFGQGSRVEANYECGFFSNDQEGSPFYQLIYPDFNYIGSDKEKSFFLENVTFDLNGKIKISYHDRVLSGQTTEEEFLKIFGENVRDNLVKEDDHDTFLLYSKGSDDGAVFTFKDGRLHKFQYWSPC